MRLDSQAKERQAILRDAAKQFQRTIAIDSENANAHYNLGLIYAALGESELEKTHKKLHLIYKPDDNAQGLAVRKGRELYPAANSAAESLVIYPLHAAPK